MNRPQLDPAYGGEDAPGAELSIGDRRPRSRSPLIVAGMHRSGTSLTASYLAAAGVDLGEPIPPDAGNPSGYFEDPEFLELDRRMLQQATAGSPGGHRDWGWTESEQLDRGCFAAFRDEACALLAGRSGASPLWGFKDPRASLLLDWWDRVAGELGADPVYLLLYRYPWDVADSMQRLGSGVFLENPEYAYRIWAFYNRHLLDFYRRHRQRALLVSTNALIGMPDRLLTLVREKLDLDLGSGPTRELRERERFVTVEGADPLIGLVAATSPRCVELLSELDREADLPSRGLWQVPPLAATLSRPESGEAPVLSVVIPCLDHGQFLIEAVASVERCACESCELIIVDDGSRQPRTLEILDLLEGAGYYVIRQAHSGLPAARNRGIEAARGRYILPLDADNRLRPGFPGEAVGILDSSPETGVVYGDCWEFGERTGRRRPPEFELNRILRANYIDACAVFRRQLWSDVGGYDTHLVAWEDWEFWIHAGARGWRFHRLDGVTFDYRVRPRSLVSRAQEPEIRDEIVRHFVAKHGGPYQRHFGGLGLVHDWLAIVEKDRAGLLQAKEDLDCDLEGLRADLSALREAAVLRDQELAARDQRIGFLEGKLEERGSVLSALRAAVELRDRELAARDRELTVRDRELAARDRELTVRDQKLAAHDRELAARDRELAARDLEIGRLEAELEGLAADLSARRETSARREQELTARQRKIDALERELGKLGAENADLLADLQEARTSFVTEIGDLTQRLSSRETDLHQIHSTMGWRLLNLQWRWVDRLLPPSSRRRRLWKRFVGVLKR